MFKSMIQMEMIPCFTDVLHVPNLSTAEHLMAVIKKSGVSKMEIFVVLFSCKSTN